jgi:hypothetical protein
MSEILFHVAGLCTWALRLQDSAWPNSASGAVVALRGSPRKYGIGQEANAASVSGKNALHCSTRQIFGSWHVLLNNDDLVLLDESLCEM